MSREAGKMYVESLGQGRDVVMVHGWGMHAGVWRGFAEGLARHFRVTLVDLPGHGRSGIIDEFTLVGLEQTLLGIAPKRSHWLGWSLGAMISLFLASRHPDRVASLVMLAGSARFVRGPDWPTAMDPAILSQFATDMIADYQNTLLRFMGLQTWGLDNARAVLKQLRECIAECDSPDLAALRAGLAILQQADLRPMLTQLRLPLLLLMGGRDRLVPAESGPAMCALAAEAQLRVIEAAGHVPFLTHPEECQSALTEFWNRYD